MFSYHHNAAAQRAARSRNLRHTCGKQHTWETRYLFMVDLQEQSTLAKAKANVNLRADIRAKARVKARGKAREKAKGRPKGKGNARAKEGGGEVLIYSTRQDHSRAEAKILISPAKARWGSLRLGSLVSVTTTSLGLCAAEKL